MSTAGTDPEHDEQVFRESPQRLKRHGCNLLSVGSVPGRTQLTAIRRLLGDDTLRRRRVVAVTDEAPDRITRLLDPTGVRILDHASVSSVRGTATATHPATPNPQVRSVESGLDALQRAIGDEIDHLERSQSLRSSELRLSVDSLRPLVGDHHLESVGEFVDGVGDRVRSVDGMAHHALPALYDSEAVQSLTDHVDATIELQAKRTGPEQRWHLPDAEVTTAWVDL